MLLMTLAMENVAPDRAPPVKIGRTY